MWQNFFILFVLLAVEERLDFFSQSLAKSFSLFLSTIQILANALLLINQNSYQKTSLNTENKLSLSPDWFNLLWSIGIKFKLSR